MLTDLVSCGFPGDIDLSPNNDTSLMLNECLIDLYRWLENCGYGLRILVLGKEPPSKWVVAVEKKYRLD